MKKGEVEKQKNNAFTSVGRCTYQSRRIEDFVSNTLLTTTDDSGAADDVDGGDDDDDDEVCYDDVCYVVDIVFAGEDDDNFDSICYGQKLHPLFVF